MKKFISLFVALAMVLSLFAGVGARTAKAAVLPGDVDGNGVVDMIDALLAARAAVHITTLTGDAFLAADVDHDGTITFSDVLLIARMAAALISVTAITDKTVVAGATVAVPVTTTPTGATIAAISSATDKATVAVTGSTVTVTGVGAGTATIAVTAAMTGYTSGTTTFGVTVSPIPVAIATPAIAGVTAPVTGATPVATIAATSEYTATISWSGSPATFAAATIYTATIILTPTAGYTLTGVTANFFTVAGATATNAAGSGVVTAVFPATAPVQLTIATPTLTLSKRYDGTTTAAVTAGALAGVVVGDVVTVTAAATYDTAAVGTGKTITVVYTLGGADAAKYVTPVNYTVATGVIRAVPPARTPITAIGTIGGTPQVGQPLAAGTLTPGTATASYQWQISADGTTYTDIGGATLSTYTPIPGDAGKFIMVVATGTGNYSGTVTSTATTAVAAATLSSIAVTTPATKLSYTVGDALDIAGLVVTGTYSDTTTQVETITTGNVTGFNSSAPAVGQTLTITVGGQTTTYTVTIVAIPITAIGVISGAPEVGIQLTAGALTPSGATASYQWRIADTSGGAYADIAGATSTTYTLAAGDVTKFIEVVATGTGSYSGSVTSAPTAVVAPAPLTAIGAITGTPQVGEVLTAGALTPTGATATATYQWRISATSGGTYADISGATATTYTLVAGDVTKFIKVVATGTGSYSGSVTSAPTAVVVATDLLAAGVTGFVAPVKGAVPIGLGVLNANAATYTKTSLVWAPTDNPYLGNIAYTATVVLTAASGYKFPIGGLTPTVNTGTPALGTVSGGDVAGNTLTFTVTFPVTAYFVIGESYGGGKVAYIDGTGLHGLIAAEVDQSTGIQWALSDPKYQSTAVGGTSQEIGTGSANTTAIINQNGTGSTYAAGLARAYQGGGYSDWYLPSRLELRTLWINRVAIDNFVLNGLYWSSSEDMYFATNADFFQFSNNDLNQSISKSSLYRVRAVRSFPSSDAIVTSGTYTVSAVTAGAGTITNVPFGTAKATFLAALAKGESHQTWNDAGIANPVVSTNILVVTAQDGSTVVTYTVTTNAELSHDARILSGTLAGVSLTGDSLNGATGAVSIGTSSGLNVNVPSASAASAALVLVKGNGDSTINYVVFQETSHSPAEPRPANDLAYTGIYASGMTFAVDSLTRIWLLVTAQDGTTEGYFWIIVKLVQATPTFSPVAGAVAFGSPVTIASAGAEHIYYTTDGTDPATSITGATLEYTAPLTINAAKTIKAIAIKAGSTNSAIGSAAYTQAVATAPSSIVLAVGGAQPVGRVTQVAIPAAGATNTTGAVRGWVTSTADKIKFTVTNGGSAASAITINSGAYTSGDDYAITAAASLAIVVTTTETGKETGVRTFTVTVAPLGSTIGDSYQGGIVAYILQSDDPGYVSGVTKGLIAATADQSTGIRWAIGSEIQTGATGTALGTGNANTNTIVGNQGAGSYAAGLCYDLTLNSYSDWYLPSEDELAQLYSNRVAIGGFNTGSGVAYWSSTETSNAQAWAQNFDNGQGGNYSKDSTYYVRAVRTF